MKNLKKCPICSAEEFTKVFFSRDYRFKTDLKKFRYVTCKSCKGILMNPQLEYEELKPYYNSDEYGPHQKRQDQPKRLPGIIYSISKVRIPERKDTPERFLPKEKNIKYLELGCGAGGDMERIKKLRPDWTIEGLEVNEVACKRARERGFKILCGSIFDADVKDGSYDLVRIKHVIEHLNNPRENLEVLSNKITKNGKIVIVTPNSNSLSFWLFKKYWYGLDSPRHLLIFNPQNLKLLLETSGFEVAKVVTHGTGKYFANSLLRVLGVSEERLPRIRQLLQIFIKPILYFTSKIGRGSIITAEAEKK